ncbi:M3 family metallopeptidase [Lapillicoccus jejuensis]|uniref:Thimet oligopeptidase n=1 Tax=Lapillicoccus jejuensis TaxID=402171 RepID=A0A542E3H0_9MICO|nr:M3 family metallopeptidase [Lapillicoccus jejuensis]TQJ09794.1 thimet oligopeptidase [Lapillicoccus jejuensis]
MTSTPAPLDLPTPDEARAWLDERTNVLLGRARTLVADLKADPPSEPMAVLDRWNAIGLALGNIGSIASLFSEVHPLEAVRSRAESAMQEAQRLSTELGLDADLYAVLAGVDASALDPLAARLLEKELLDFRRAGVDRDEETRERIRALSQEAVLVGQQFSKNVRDDVRTVQVRPEQLDGLPQDWVDAHPAGADGLVTLTTDYPDVVPFSTFGRDAAVRRELRIAFLNRGWPQNDALLHRLFEIRHEHATLLGYADWAAFDAEVKMIKEGPAIPAFIDKIADAALESGLRDREILLERMREDAPGAESIDAADLAFYAEAVRRERFDVDAQQVRRYFDFTRVRQGLLDVTGRLFGLTYRPAADAVVWHEDVVAYDVLLADDEAAGPLGRIFLDLHPRDGKFKHAAQFDLARGVRGAGDLDQLPEGALVCNFPRGLMEHSDVTTLFHEFGHLVHHVLAGQGRWARFSGVATEWDFVEAPSQMLEEWAWDADVLQTFAVDAAGERIPRDLVERMRTADDFGKGYLARTQMFYAGMSYWFHVDRPEDLTAATQRLQERYSLFPYIEGTHMPASFGHLEGYSSAYYTYMWSLVIAKDMFSAFDRGDLFAPDVARAYRDKVLARGGQADAADLVADFLGRPYTFDAYAAWLAE